MEFLGKSVDKGRAYGLLSIVLATILLFNFIPMPMSMDMKHEGWVLLKDDMQQELLSNSQYKCCLEEPCTYCLVEEGECDCLTEIIEGVHPCGECIGEILEGHGNKYLTKYFARAIGEKVGENHIDDLREIVFEKYGTPIEEQL